MVVGPCVVLNVLVIMIVGLVVVIASVLLVFCSGGCVWM